MLLLLLGRSLFLDFFLLALLDDLGLGRRRGRRGGRGFSRRWLFLGLRHDPVDEHRLAFGDRLPLRVGGDVADAHTLVQHQLADVDVHMLGDVAGKALDDDLAPDELEDATLLLDALRFPVHEYRDCDLNEAIHRHAIEVRVQYLMRDRIDLKIPDQHARGARAGQLQRDQRVLTRFGVEDLHQRLRGNRHRPRFLAVAVEHGGHLAAPTRAPRFVLAECIAWCGFEYCFHDQTPSLSNCPVASFRLRGRSSYTNNEETDVSSWMLLIACPSSRATDSTTILSHAAACGDSGIVLVTISLSIGDCSMRSIAGPDSTPWTAHASTCAAPLALSAVAPLVIVPAVSMMSSCKMHVRPSTSPITFITSAVPSSERRLSMMASSASRRLA